MENKGKKNYTSQQDSSQWKRLLLGGLLPLIAYTVIEESFGIVWGLIAGMAISAAEILYEWLSRRKVDMMTWIGSGLMLGLGSISLVTQEGIWFRMQPAILEFAMALLLVGSVLARKPFLLLMAKKQGVLLRVPKEVQPSIELFFTGLTLRIGLFFFLHAILAAYAAIYWSVRAWMLLKGVGFTVSLLAYMVIEMFLFRKRLSKQQRPEHH